MRRKAKKLSLRLREVRFIRLDASIRHAYKPLFKSVANAGTLGHVLKNIASDTFLE